MNRYSACRALAILFAALLAAACQNNGDIGYLFGTWRIDSMTVDGQPDPAAAAQTLISFQNDIIEVQRIFDADGTFANFFGTWAEDGDIITINFTHHADDPDDQAFNAPEWLGWTAAHPMQLSVSSRSSRTVTWTFTADDGTVYVYNLRKTW